MKYQGMLEDVDTREKVAHPSYKDMDELDSQTLLTHNYFRQYLGTIMVSKQILRMGAQRTSIQKTYKRNTGQDSLNIDFIHANRQSEQIELSIVYDKNDKHTSVYDSFNVELAAKTVKSIKLSNFTETYSLTNKKKI